MKKLNNFWFGFLLATTLWAMFMVWTDTKIEITEGAKVFMIAPPIAVIHWKIWSVERAKEEKKMNMLRKKYQRYKMSKN